VVSGVETLTTQLLELCKVPASQALPLARWTGLGVLLVAEALVIGLRFDGFVLEGDGRWWSDLVVFQAHLRRFAIPVVLTTLLFGGAQLWDKLPHESCAEFTLVQSHGSGCSKEPIEVRKGSCTMKTRRLLTALLLLLAAPVYADVMPGDPAGGPTDKAKINVSVSEDGTAMLNGMNATSVVGLDEDGNMRTFFSLGGSFVRGGDVMLTDGFLSPSDILRFHNPSAGLVLGYADWFTLYSDLEPGDHDPADVGLPIMGDPMFADTVPIAEGDPTMYMAGTAKYEIHSDPPEGAPEIDPGSMAGALTLLSTGVLMLTSRRRRSRLFVGAQV
jgi:hypothetical protein